MIQKFRKKPEQVVDVLFLTKNAPAEVAEFVRSFGDKNEFGFVVGPDGPMIKFYYPGNIETSSANDPSTWPSGYEPATDYVIYRTTSMFGKGEYTAWKKEHFLKSYESV